MEGFVCFDDREFQRLERLMRGCPDLFRKACKSAIRRAAQGMRAGLGRGIRQKTYLRGREVSGAIGAAQFTSGGLEASVRVAGRKQQAHKFRLQPNRVTARKGSPSVSWPSPGVKPGPSEPLLNPGGGAYSKAFIAQRGGLKAMYLREKASGKLVMPTIASPQYYASFKDVHEPLLQKSGDVFIQRLEHEIDYRLGLGR